MYWIKRLLPCLLLLWLAGCQTPSGQREPEISSRLGTPAAVRAALLDQYGQWRGVPYRTGGTSRYGVDCSAFVQITFRQQFGLQLPRDTDGQARIGVAVRSGQRQPGDLLFFNTGRFSRHVGIYLQQGQFLHASTSKGVIISSLDNPYWRKTYSQTRRLSQ